MTSQGTAQSVSCYMDLKLPKPGGTKFKSWERFWVVFRTMTDTTVQRSLVTVYLYSDKIAATKPFPNKSTLLLDSVTSVRRVKSKSHPFAFAVNCVQPLAYFSGRTETESQQTMLFLRHTYWPPVLNLEPKSEFHEVSVMENSYALALGLSYNYWLRVQTTSLSLYDVRDNKVVYVWKYGALKRFFLASAEYKCGSDNILVIQAGPNTQAGEGQLMLFSEAARIILENIMSCIKQLLRSKHKGDDDKKRSESTTSANLRSMLNNIGEVKRLDITSSFSDDSVETSSQRSSLPILDDEVNASPKDQSSERNFEPLKIGPDKLLRSQSLFDSQQVRNDMHCEKHLVRSNSCYSRDDANNEVSPPHTPIDSPSSWGTKDINKWINNSSTEVAQISTSPIIRPESLGIQIQRQKYGDFRSPTSPLLHMPMSPLSNRSTDSQCSESLRDELYEALGILGSSVESLGKTLPYGSPVKLRHQRNQDRRQIDVETLKTEVQTPEQRLSQSERRRKVSSDSTHTYMEHEGTKTDSVTKSKSTSDVQRKDEDSHSDLNAIKTLQTNRKDLNKFFGTGDYDVSTNLAKQKSMKNRWKSVKDKQTNPSEPLGVPPKLSKKSIISGKQHGEIIQSSIVDKVIGSDKSKQFPANENAALEINRPVIIGTNMNEHRLSDTDYVQPDQIESYYSEICRNHRNDTKIKAQSEIMQSSQNIKNRSPKKDKLPDLPTTSPPMLRSSKKEIKLIDHNPNKSKSKAPKKLQCSHSGVLSDPLIDYENMSFHHDTDLHFNDKHKRSSSKTNKKHTALNTSFNAMNIAPASQFDHNLTHGTGQSPSTFMFGKIKPNDSSDAFSTFEEHTRHSDQYEIYNKPRNIIDNKVIRYDDTNTDEFPPPPEILFNEIYDVPKNLTGIIDQTIPAILNSDVSPPIENNQSHPIFTKKSLPPVVKAKPRKLVGAKNEISANTYHTQDSTNDEEDLYDTPISFAGSLSKIRRNLNFDFFNPTQNTDDGDSGCANNGKTPNRFSQKRQQLQSVYMDDDNNALLLDSDYKDIYIDMSGRCKLRNPDGTETDLGSV